MNTFYKNIFLNFQKNYFQHESEILINFNLSSKKPPKNFFFTFYVNFFLYNIYLTHKHTPLNYYFFYLLTKQITKEKRM